jgi:acetyl esterase/lipase
MIAPILYLVVSCFGAAMSLLAFFPGPRKGKAGGLFFLAGWFVGDLAPWHVAWQAVATVLFGLAGAFDRWPGWLGLAITFASWCLLVAGVARAKRTAAVIDASLVSGLGPDYRAQIRPELAETLSDGSARLWGNPFRSRHQDVVRTKNISYGPAGKRNLLDVYRPKSITSPCPVLVYIHGGAWTMGSKDRQGLPLMLYLAARGWVCIAPNYRLSPKSSFPDHLIDIKRVLAWVREHGAEYGADPTMIAVAGGSAGGHLAALAGLTANAPEYQPGFETVDTSVIAAVPLYGAYDLLDRHRVRPDTYQIKYLQKRKVLKSSPEEDRDEWEKASPVSWVHLDAPPFFVLHGHNDSLLFFEDATYFVDALRNVSHQPVVHAQLPGAQHAFDTLHTLRAGAVVEGVARFLSWVRSTRHSAAAR